MSAKDRSVLRIITALPLFTLLMLLPVYGQTYQTQYFAPGTSGSSSTNYLKNSAAFRQEIMRMEINVVRGTRSLPVTQVPRVQKGDVIKMKLLDEAVGGIKPDQSYWDWTFLVAFVNPNRRQQVKGADKQNAVTQEIQFKKTGWYKQYSFEVPYDSQPVFFLYPRPKYRNKILKVVSRNYDEVRKLGEKTIEMAGAYAQISSFLNELQYVFYQTQQSRYYIPPTVGSAVTSPYNTSGTSTYNPYTTTGTGTYNPYTTTGTYNPYTTTTTTNNAANQPKTPEIPPNYNFYIEQTVERLARSFNVALPSCWGTGGGYNSAYNSSSNSSYNSSYNSPYNSTYNSSGYNNSSSYNSYNTGGNQNNFGYLVSQELIARGQCVAKNIRLEDFDFSVSKMLQQGGMFVAAQLRDKFPQLSYWINIAAVAIDFIVKVFQKAMLKIVPTIVQASDGGGSGGSSPGGSYQTSYAAQSGYTSSFSSGSTGTPSSFSPGSPGSLGSNSSYTPPGTQTAAPVKIALYAESQPDDQQFVTAYPIVVHKWQQEPDPEVISIPPPMLAEPCLHAGVNLLKNSALTEEPEADTFTKDFKLVMSSNNGFKKEFPLKKNIGLGGWELNLSKEDLNSFPKIQMTLESQITGTRGFNEIKSPVFNLPLSLGGTYEVKPEAQKAFTVGARRTVTVRNTLGGCQCLQAIIYKPSFGGQFVYEAASRDRNNQLQYSPDGREVSFDIDASSFQPGAGQLDLRTFGGESTILNLKLYPLPPNVTNVKMARGDNQAVISGDRLEQLQYVKINGRRATVVGNAPQTNSTPGGISNGSNSSNGSSTGSSGGVIPYGTNPAVNQSSFPGGSQPPAQYPNSSSQPQSGSNPFAPPTGLSQPPQGSQNPLSIVNPYASTPQTQPTPPNNPPSSAPGSNPYAVVVPTATVIPNIVQSAAPSGNPSGQAAQMSGVLLSSNERLVIFDDPSSRLTDNMIAIELGLEDDRTYSVSRLFQSAPSRPAIVIGADREIEAAPGGQVPESRNELYQAVRSVFAKDVLPVETTELSLNVQTSLTDYDFKVENLSIETRIEKSGAAIGSNSYGGSPFGAGGAAETIKPSFEVLDWKNMRVSFALSEGARKTLGGRRLQFRIRDRERGDSDWYTIRQTFVRVPEISAVKCTDETPGKCELSGERLDYIGQISVDGGKSWLPDGNGSLQSITTADGRKVVLIPFYPNKKLLMVKLRDYARMEGVNINDYTFTNTVKPVKKQPPPVASGTPVSAISPANPVSAAPPGGVPVNQIPNSRGINPTGQQANLPKSNPPLVRRKKKSSRNR